VIDCSEEVAAWHRHREPEETPTDVRKSRDADGSEAQTGQPTEGSSVEEAEWLHLVGFWDL